MHWLTHPATNGTPPPPLTGATVTYIPGAVGHAGHSTPHFFIFAGESEHGPTSDLYTLNLSTMMFFKPTTRGKIPAPRHRHTMLYIQHQDRFIMFGGVGGGANLYCLDPDTFEWTLASTTGKHPSARYSHTMMQIDRDYVLLFSGKGSSNESLNDLFLLNLNTWEWQILDEIEGQPPLDCSNIVCIPIQGKLHVYGSEDDLEFIFDPEARTWTEHPIPSHTPYPLSKCSRFGMDVVENEAFLFGGVASRQVLGQLFNWNTTSKTWLPIVASGTVPSQRFGHCCVLVDYRLFIFYGRDRHQYFNEIYELDATPLKWEKPSFAGSSPGARVSQGFIRYGQRVYAIGGASHGIALNDVRRLDLVTMHWDLVETFGDRPPALVSHTIALLDSTIYVFGGGDGRKATNDLYAYEIPSRTWRRLPFRGAPPAPRVGHSASMIGRRMYIFGGFCQGRYFSDLHAFDIDSSTWFQEQPEGQGPSGRVSHSATVYGNKIVFFGGSLAGKALGDIFILNTEDMHWEKPQATGIHPLPRFAHTASLFSNKLFIFGGGARGNAFNDVSFFDIDKHIWTKSRTTSNVPEPRSRHTAFTFGPRMFIYGGGTGKEQRDDLMFLITDENIPDEPPCLDDVDEEVLTSRTGQGSEIEDDGIGVGDEDGQIALEPSLAPPISSQTPLLSKIAQKHLEKQEELAKTTAPIPKTKKKKGVRIRRVKRAPGAIPVIPERESKPIEVVDKMVRQAKLRQRPEVSVEELGDILYFLRMSNLSQYARLFRQQEIDLRVFLLLTRSDLIGIGIEDENDISALLQLQSNVLHAPKLTKIEAENEDDLETKIQDARYFAKRYLMGEKILWGGSEVVLAVDSTTNRSVILKFISNLSQFRHEVHLYKNLDHQYVNRMFDAIEDLNCPLGHCIVLQYTSTLLSDYIRSHALTAFERKMIVEQIVGILQYVHGSGGALTAFSPDMFGIFANRTWRLLNVHSLRMVGDEIPLSIPLAYAAPELIQHIAGRRVWSRDVEGQVADSFQQAHAKQRGEVFVSPLIQPLQVTPSTDIWSFGMLLYQIYAQMPMFRTDEEAFSGLGGVGVIQLSSLGIIDDIQANHLVRRCLVVSPESRIQAQDVTQHAYLRGGLDKEQMAMTFGRVQSSISHVISQIDWIKERFDERKRVVKEIQAECEAEMVERMIQHGID